MHPFSQSGGDLHHRMFYQRKGIEILGMAAAGPGPVRENGLKIQEQKKRETEKKTKQKKTRYRKKEYHGIQNITQKSSD